jgi:thioester reductase-like protein
VSSPVILLTGFPGFLGTRLVRRLLSDDEQARVIALVEPKMAERAREVAAGIDAGRIEILPGDIADRSLDLGREDYERVAAEVTSVHHLAAIYSLDVPSELAQAVNVEGTGNILELCGRAERLERLNYVSTAYVAGLRKGVVYEHELFLGQGFKNHYESTKFQAEVWVRERMDSVPTTIYRPAIVVGDSRTGETQKFDGPYYLLRVISRAQRHGLPIAQIGKAGVPFNVVPVDFVIEAIAAAAQDERAVGETFHLADPDPVTARELMTIFAREYAGTEPRFSVPAAMVRESLRLRAMRAAFAGTPRESVRYLGHHVRFDTRRAGDLLGRHGLRCPSFPEYAGPITRFFREHEDDPAYMPAG